MKLCSKCKILKPATDYCRMRKSKDGLQARCRACGIAASRAYKARTGYRAAPAERMKKRQRIGYRILSNLRSCTKARMNGTSFAAPFLEMLGCNEHQLVEHLQRTLPANLDINTAYGEYEVDHVRPLASFDLTIKQQQFEAFHYSNLQLLHRDENNRKRDALVWPPTIEVREAPSIEPEHLRNDFCGMTADDLLRMVDGLQ